MKKRMFALLVAAATVLSLAACGGGSKAGADSPAASRLVPAASSATPAPAADPEPPESPADADEAILQLRELLADAGVPCGAAYLGYVEDSTDPADLRALLELSPLTESYPGIEALADGKVVYSGGYELYLVVPAEDSIEVTVLGLDYDQNGNETVAQPIYAGDGTPFLLVCNFSEIMTNARIRLEELGEFSLYLSGMDGSLCTTGDVRVLNLDASAVLPIEEQDGIDLTFSSGAGGWATELTLYPDGWFEGSFHDSDMGDTGEQYPNGTLYVCDFEGWFEDVFELDDGTWSMSLAGLIWDEENLNLEWYEDGMRIVQSGPYGMEEGVKFRLYLPDYPSDGLSEDLYIWWPGRYDEVPSELLGEYCLENVEMVYGFFGG